MAGNKYQQYLNDDRASSRSSRLGEELKSTAKFAVGISAIIGAGIGAKHLYTSGTFDDVLSGAGSLINKAVDNGRTRAMKTGAIADALSKTAKNSGFWNTFTGKADDALEKTLRANFALVHTNANKPLSGVETQIENLLKKSGHVKSEAIKSYIQGRKLDFIEEDFGNAVGKDSDFFKDIIDVLRNDTNNKGLLDKSNNEHLFKLFNSHKLNEKYTEDQLKTGSIQLEEILQKYRGKPTEWAKPLSTLELKNKAKELGKIIDSDFMKILQPNNTAKTRFLEKMGIKSATVEDALKHPEWFEGQRQYIANNIGKTTRAEFVEKNTYKKLQNLVTENPEARKLTLGKSIVMDAKSGKLVDYRYVSDIMWKAFDFAADNLQVPLVNINPLRLAHAITIEGVRKAEPMAILRKGSKQAFLTGNTDDLGRDLLYSGNKVYDIMSGKVIKDDVYLASSRYGMFKRIAENMGELGEQKKGNWLQETFDIGLQERQNEWQHQSSFISKFFNPKWDPNLIHGMEKQYDDFGNVSENVAEAAYKKVYDTLNRKVRPLNNNTMEKLTPSIKEMFPDFSDEDIMMGNDEQVMITLGKLLKMESEESTRVYSQATGLNSQLRGNASLYSKNKDIFEMMQQAVSDPEVALPGFLDSLQPSNTRMVDKYTDTKRLVQQEILSQIEANKIDYSNAIKGLTDKEIESVSELSALDRLRRMWSSIQGLDGKYVEDAEESKKAALDKFVGIITDPDETEKASSIAIKKAVDKYNPWWGYGPGDKPNNVLGNTPYIVMNKTRNPITSINETIKNGGSVWDGVKVFAEDTVGQMGFGPKSIRAGRTNLDKVSTLTAGSYYYFDRLNEGISRTGLGLSQKSLGSAQDIFGNLLLKRYGAAMLAVNALNSLNYETEKATGIEPSDTLGKAYVNMTLDVAKIKDITGITGFNKMLGRIMPGSDKLFKNPLGGAIKYGSFGLIGDERDYDELKEYWTEGEDPVRKGRWWGIGSNTPWYGGKIDHYAPNWYRRIKSDYKYTNVLYGSKDEYWANNWMPTLSHPFAPINRFLLDPNHWANKHREDRPYPIYGGYSELNDIPIIGPTLNGTIGQILNPERRRGDLAKAHRQYLTDINESIKSQSAGDKGGYVYTTPAGGTSIVSMDDEASWGQSANGGIYSQVPTENGDVAIVDATSGFAPMQSGGKISEMQLSAINKGYVSRSAIGSSSSGSLDSFRDKEFLDDLDEAVDPRSAAYRFGETFYSITELGGIYGFALTSFTGDGATKKPVLARAMDMNSSARMFWDMQLGGAGGDISEIGRRFIPKKRREEQYNPFRNTQPDWMPGAEYFQQDFKHGDPYAKISNGEYRLPGAGYESLNKLHPDMFGEYGALDRFKILADVAPYSDQYRYYKHVVSVYNQMGWLSDGEKKDINTIKSQVREAKKKYEFTPYKFKYADIDEKYVTIDHMVDDTTFVAEEFPDHPIRLAGIDMPPKSDTSEAAEAAREYLRQQLKPGKRVKIGIDSDTLFRTRDDTMQTMRAVVYDSTGHSMSARLARSKYGAFMGVFGGSNAVEGDWDSTEATTVRALYSKEEITLGKAWEFISHLDTPLHTKLLQNRSPLEQYKRRELYGKNWQSWEHPIRDWLKPTFNKMTQSNPIVATGVGAFIGSLFSSGSGKKITATVGGAIAGVASTLRVANEAAGRIVNSEYTWIPKERRRERQIDEYFDVLEYMKYKGLYEKTRKIAIQKEGTDVERFIGLARKGGDKVQSARKALEEKKRWIKINMSDTSIDQEEAKRQLDEINAQLNEFDNQRGLSKLGPYALQAMKYKTAYESTLYGADPYGGATEIFRALPNKDREFFKEFILAAPEEREEILRLVPKNQRRFYQAKWGMKLDTPPTLDSYFNSHYLPDASWEGWKPDVSLEAVKLKVVRNEALDMGEFGFFQGDEKRAAGAPNIKPFQPSAFLDLGKITRVLKGMGLTNVDVRKAVSPSDEHGFNIDINLSKDRRKDITDIMNSDMTPIIST